jgi:hypothetical protein
MAPNGYAIVTTGGDVVRTFTSLPDRIEWPNRDRTQPAAVMRHAEWRFVERLSDIPTETRTHKLGPLQSAMVDGSLVESAALVDRTPEEIATWDDEHKPAPVNALHFRLALLEAQLLDAVETYVSGAPREVKLAWEFHGEIDIDNPMVIAAAGALGVNAAALRALFERAAAIEPGA